MPKYRKIKTEKQNRRLVKRFCIAIHAFLLNLRLILQQLWCEIGIRHFLVFSPNCHQRKISGVNRYDRKAPKCIFRADKEHHAKNGSGITIFLFGSLRGKSINPYFPNCLVGPIGPGKKFVYRIQINDTKTFFVNSSGNLFDQVKLYKSSKGSHLPNFPVLYICKTNICEEILSFA